MQHPNMSVTKSIQLFHSLCLDELDQTLRVQFRPLSDFPGGNISHFSEINVALPFPEKKPTSMSIFSGDYPEIDPFIITHELGHWIMRLRGFKNVKYGNNPRDMKSIHITNLCDHPVVTTIQKEVDYDPQEWNNHQAHKSTIFVNKYPPYFRLGDRIDLLLYMADKLYNCSSSISGKIFRKMKRFHPVNEKLVRKILDTMKNSNLLDPNENLSCRLEIGQGLGLSGLWNIHDDLAILKNRVK